MEQQKLVYVCTGGCGGAAWVQKNCGDSACSLYNHQLEPRKQCQSCEAKSKEDNEPHACPMCTKPNA